VSADPARVRGAARAGAVAIALQAAHFAEELATGFERRFPESLGLAPWSVRFFVALNLLWLAAWVASVPGLRARRRAALFPLWFLALAAVANGVGHPLLAARAGGYFPGLFTSPLVGVAGAVLLWRLGSVTDGARRGASDRARAAYRG
jgi:hypothetical protein